MNSVPISFCVAMLLLAPTASFASNTTPEAIKKSAAFVATTHITRPTTNVPAATTNLTTVQTTTKPGNTTTVHTTSRPTATISGASTATATAAASVTNTTSPGIATTALPIVSHFDIGSFIGGIVLALGIIALFYFGRRICISRSGTRYRTIEETEAII
ncbi:porimin isoform X3 [Heptranchias perlo]|uniref:porimin isoform X3 n=1 Tax=Heptranchias perlo TaxID=212740 RepID=UPI003559FE16